MTDDTFLRLAVSWWREAEAVKRVTREFLVSLNHPHSKSWKNSKRRAK
jgi:hypothetical protein